MAIGEKSFLFGKTTGQIGGVISNVDRAGRIVLRQKPDKVHNPRTVAQVNQREKFALIQDVGKAALGLIGRGFRDRLDTNPLHSAINRYMSYNLKNVFTGSTIDTIDYGLMRFGKGSLAPVVVNTFGAVVNPNDVDKFDVTINSVIDNGEAADVMLIGVIALNDAPSVMQISGSRATADRNITFDCVEDGLYLVVAAFVSREEYDVKGVDPNLYFADTSLVNTQSNISCLGTYLKA